MPFVRHVARGGLALVAGLLLPVGATVRAAEPAPFDLAGPVLRVAVTHGGETLPIAQVPQLAVGDRIAVRADLPESQSAHYLLIAAFLRGATNPPPDKWFVQAETWTKKGRRGLTLIVPEGAQQVALFLAPATGGDFSTLRDTVKGRPGAFVRAAQELTQASLDRARLDTYLAAVRRIVAGDPERLDRITPLLARSLQVKIDTGCLAKLPELQAACLLQNQESIVLNDGHSNAITDAVAGPGADLALQLSATPQGGLGYYSPYIAAIRDVIGILGSIRTAKYQYIPALGVLDGDRMALVLNAAPSFHNPKSVMVAALPIVAPVHVPPLQLAGANPMLCAGPGDAVLPMNGAPLVYATDYAHDLALRVAAPGGRTIELPATPDAERGGLVVRSGMLPADAATPLTARLHGRWGFQPFDGPSVPVMAVRPGAWRLDGAAPGRDIVLTGGAAACVTGISMRIGDSATVATRWTAARPDTLAIVRPAGTGDAETMIEVHGPGGSTPDRLRLAAPPPSPAPRIALIARDVRRPPASGLALTPGSDADVPSDATLTISLRALDGQAFTGRETLEVAAGAGGRTATLAVGRGLTLADPKILLASFVGGTALGPSAFGPLRLRIMRGTAASEWLPIGTLVRLPAIDALRCPPEPAAPCVLAGTDLFLVAAVGARSDLADAVAVPEGFPGQAITVPRPIDGGLFLRLHDDPAAQARIAG